MSDSINLTPIGRFTPDFAGEGSAEINVYDPISQRIFVINGVNDTIDVLDLSDPTGRTSPALRGRGQPLTNPSLALAIDITAFGGGVNSVAVENGILAAAIENDNPQAPGQVVFFDTDGNFLNSVTAGALPDMIVFTADGEKLLIANEGEADGDIDPNGSISVIDLANRVENATVNTAELTGFNGKETE